jgi:hypothetical protein
MEAKQSEICRDDFFKDEFFKDEFCVGVFEFERFAGARRFFVFPFEAVVLRSFAFVPALPGSSGAG